MITILFKTAENGFFLQRAQLEKKKGVSQYSQDYYKFNKLNWQMTSFNLVIFYSLGAVLEKVKSSGFTNVPVKAPLSWTLKVAIFSSLVR